MNTWMSLDASKALPFHQFINVYVENIQDGWRILSGTESWNLSFHSMDRWVTGILSFPRLFPCRKYAKMNL